MMTPTYFPKLTWQKIATNICQHKRMDYLVIIDYYSQWIEVKELTIVTSECVISRIKGLFIAHDVPGLCSNAGWRV